MGEMKINEADFAKALQIGRPPNIKKLFPNSKALLVSGKVIDRAFLAKGKAMTIAVNCRNQMIISGALQAAQRANAAIILEIAKSEGGKDAYCAINYWTMARMVDSLCNEMGITVPVAIHADHYGLKSPGDVDEALSELPSLFEAGITSIAIDASHMPDDENLLTNLKLNKHIPACAGYETEVGEIKGTEGLSTSVEALFLVRGLNAHGIFPDWIALNNGTAHGIQSGDQGIQVDLTKEIHQKLTEYHVSGAQHGTSGNDSDRLRQIANVTLTTKANVATALQMISWGVKVNDFGNALLDGKGNFIKDPNAGITSSLWEEMTAVAKEKGLTGGGYKKLNLPFETRMMRQSGEIRNRMAKGVEDFVYNLLTNVFNAEDTAPLAVNEILQAGSYDMGAKCKRIEDPAEWTEVKLRERAAAMDTDKGPDGDFDD